ncbi:NAD(+) diphosphatase [Falsirhodobacter algicola]|uniref:NAD(+) diphosphatase n=1 Tax=Falsirhodobacter algicola TaxID=2692330 RepID=UPI0020139AB1|nr:NAD(+) diphosphatase [Falsirhodobacter algicola]
MHSIAFASSGHDRAAHLRDGGQDRPARILPVWQGRFPAGPEGLIWRPADDPALQGRDMIYLGRDARNDFFACEMEQPEEALSELRALMTTLSPPEGEMAATARALFNWHRSHGFCAACGAPSRMAQGGWLRICDACGARHFPRTDPVVIMLVRRGDRMLLGRAAQWPAGMHSCLAGFVEPGETPEAAVRREVQEEAGIRTGAVRYILSQPWPFPSSLMMGFVAEAEEEALTIDPVELESALWADRQEVVRALAGTHPDISLPREGTIARHLILRWLADDLDPPSGTETA